MSDAGETARAVFKCGAKVKLPNMIGAVLCNRTLETRLYYNDDESACFYIPGGWHIELGYMVSQGANTIVRCPEHCNRVSDHWVDVPGAGTEFVRH